MLNLGQEDLRGDDVIRRSFAIDPWANTMSLGCPSCPHFVECGGLHVEAPLLDCQDLCCNRPETCSRVCRNNPQKFVAQRREIGGFDLNETPRAPQRPSNLRSDVVELIYHRSRRQTPLREPTVALRLADIVDYSCGRAKFSSRLEMCENFRIDPSCNIILTGVDHDHRIEPWWSLSNARIPIIRTLSRLGIALVSTPNFSLLVDSPRTDDIYSMKRIAINFAEFQQEGISCALHPNGRAVRDFERWAEFIAMRPEVSTLSYEFITGSGLSARRQIHLDGLINIARTAGRHLDIVVRGDPKVIPILMPHYREIIYIDTTAYMKAQKRFLAERTANDGLAWNHLYTEPGAAIDHILQKNIEEQREFLKAKYFGKSLHSNRAA
ncbi:MAG: DUF4417 domain-containing protein [Parvibaculum sp.]|nr:DUF4417 domain-containing protein [Parvibaculum sp.]|tara:strand:- start:990 stop:2132 length:1143 start_codon:yes stop_codon:yes gene_type:complete